MQPLRQHAVQQNNPLLGVTMSAAYNLSSILSDRRVFPPLIDVLAVQAPLHTHMSHMYLCFLQLV